MLTLKQCGLTQEPLPQQAGLFLCRMLVQTMMWRVGITASNSFVAAAAQHFLWRNVNRNYVSTPCFVAAAAIFHVAKSLQKVGGEREMSAY